MYEYLEKVKHDRIQYEKKKQKILIKKSKTMNLSCSFCANEDELQCNFTTSGFLRHVNELSETEKRERVRTLSHSNLIMQLKKKLNSFFFHYGLRSRR